MGEFDIMYQISRVSMFLMGFASQKKHVQWIMSRCMEMPHNNGFMLYQLTDHKEITSLNVDFILSWSGGDNIYFSDIFQWLYLVYVKDYTLASKYYIFKIF